MTQITDEARKEFVLRAIAVRQKTNPKFGRFDIFPDCNFGSLDTYSGVVADLALRELSREALKCAFMHGDVRGMIQHYRDQFLRMREERDRALHGVELITALLAQVTQERDVKEESAIALAESGSQWAEKCRMALTERDRAQAALRWAWKVVHTGHDPLDANQCDWPICVACRAALKPEGEPQVIEEVPKEKKPLSDDELWGKPDKVLDAGTARLAQLEAENRAILIALRDILEIGKRDLSNPKYDSYFEAAYEALAKATGRQGETKVVEETEQQDVYTEAWNAAIAAAVKVASRQTYNGDYYSASTDSYDRGVRSAVSAIEQLAKPTAAKQGEPSDGLCPHGEYLQAHCTQCEQPSPSSANRAEERS